MCMSQGKLAGQAENLSSFRVNYDGFPEYERRHDECPSGDVF